MTRDEIYSALAFTARECAARATCEGCAFNRGFDKDGKRKCGLAKYPHNWQIPGMKEKEADK